MGRTARGLARIIDRMSRGDAVQPTCGLRLQTVHTQAVGGRAGSGRERGRDHT